MQTPPTSALKDCTDDDQEISIEHWVYDTERKSWSDHAKTQYAFVMKRKGVQQHACSTKRQRLTI